MAPLGPGPVLPWDQRQVSPASGHLTGWNVPRPCTSHTPAPLFPLPSPPAPPWAPVNPLRAGGALRGPRPLQQTLAPPWHSARFVPMNKPLCLFTKLTLLGDKAFVIHRVEGPQASVETAWEASPAPCPGTRAGWLFCAQAAQTAWTWVSVRVPRFRRGNEAGCVDSTAEQTLCQGAQRLCRGRESDKKECPPGDEDVETVVNAGESDTGPSRPGVGSGLLQCSVEPCPPHGPGWRRPGCG